MSACRHDQNSGVHGLGAAGCPGVQASAAHASNASWASVGLKSRGMNVLPRLHAPSTLAARTSVSLGFWIFRINRFTGGVVHLREVIYNH